MEGVLKRGVRVKSQGPLYLERGNPFRKNTIQVGSMIHPIHLDVPLTKGTFSNKDTYFDRLGFWNVYFIVQSYIAVLK